MISMKCVLHSSILQKVVSDTQKSFLRKSLRRRKGEGCYRKAYSKPSGTSIRIYQKRQILAQLLNFIQDEHPQTIALILIVPSCLHRHRQLCHRLPPEKQADVARRIAQMDRTSPDVIKQVEKVLEK